MFGKGIKLFKIFGFEVRADASWLVIAFLVTWTLAKGMFPYHYPGLSASTYWIMGIFGALGLFASILIHEFFHSFVARKYGLPMHGITLFMFGGVAQMKDEPTDPKTEFLMAIAGPITSIILGFIFFQFVLLGRAVGWPTPLVATVNYLKYINWLLAAFNMLPAFPLDGGRVLRSAIWHWKGNLRLATHISSQIGVGLGTALILMGILSILMGGIIGGMWWILIGMFLRGVAQGSYQKLLMRQTLEGEPVSRFMKEDPVTVSPSISIDELVEDYVYKHHFKMFPVVDEGRLLGCVTTRDIKNVPRDQWGSKDAKSILRWLGKENTVDPGMDAMKALDAMNRTGKSRFLVARGERLLGVVTLKDLLKFFSLKIGLEGEEDRS